MNHHERVSGELIAAFARRAGQEGKKLHFYLCPGARSAPFSQAAFLAHKACCEVFPDERSAAFAALGYAKAGRALVILVCTSGTALGHFLPALMEAHHARVPLLVITADRPRRLQGKGARQTTNQQKIFGSFVCSFLHVESSEVQVLAVASIAEQALLEMEKHKMPAHINIAFDEPLLSDKAEFMYPEAAHQEEYSEIPVSMQCKTHEPVLEQLKPLLDQAQRPLAFVGGLTQNEQDKQAIIDFLHAWEIPCLLDIRSGLRGRVRNSFSHASLFFASEQARKAISPDLFLHIGDSPSSRSLGDFLQDISCPRLAIRSLATAQEEDDLAKLRIFIPLGELGSCKPSSPLCRDDSLLQRLLHFETYAGHALAELSRRAQLEEWAIFPILQELLCEEHFLFLSNSLPLRLADMGLADFSRAVFANRGLSGIDGILSTAIGLASAFQEHGALRQGSCVLGDLAAFHDFNAFGMLAQKQLPLRVIILNNGGGQIFSTLSDLAQSAAFPAIFQAAPPVDFSGISRSFSLPFFRVGCALELQEAWQSSTRELPCPSVIEIMLAPDSASRSLADLQAQLQENMKRDAIS